MARSDGTDPPAAKRPAVALGVSGLAAAAAAAAAGAVAGPAVSSRWYADLAKPSWQPPSAAFGPVWSVLYAAQAVAAWLVWRESVTAGVRRDPPLRLYGAQLLLNAAWSPLFFGARRIGWALLDIAVLWVAIAATIDAFRRRSRVAALMLVPYLAWVTFAAALNSWIWWRNR